MFIKEITNRPDFQVHIINELKENYGINYRRDKKQKSTQVSDLLLLDPVPKKN